MLLVEATGDLATVDVPVQTPMFKFIVPAGKEEDVKKLFPKHTSSEKHSKEGKYTSVTVQMMMPSSDAVVNVYEQASAIEGIIAL